MVIKGGARAEADKLAAHLLRVDMNERVDVRAMDGVISSDLTAALLEMEAVASAARSRRPFYHASINTAPNELMTDAQKARAIDRLEQELGLAGQPRVVVEHVKEGREHLHVAWSRIDAGTLAVIPDSHNYRRHEIVARALEREFGHARVQGAHHERDGEERPARRPSHAETMQAERSGVTSEDARAQLRALWQSADNGQAFAAALDNAGWTLAQGDKRGFVALDPAGEVRAVNKDITGLTAAKVRERLADLDADRLPSVDEARGQLRERIPVPSLEAGRADAEKAREDLRPEIMPAHQAERSREETDELATHAERQRQAFEDAVRGPVLGGMEGAAPSPEATQRPSHKAENTPAPAKAPEIDTAALLRQLDDWFRAAPEPVWEAVPQPARQPEPERVRERTRTPEPAAQPAPEPARPSLFQMLTMGVRAWWQGLHADRAADRQQPGPDIGREPVRVPEAAPVQQPQPAREPETVQQRPAERMRRSIADEWLAEARAELAAERARETPAQRIEREKQEADRSRGRGDGGRERTRSRYHHSRLWELMQTPQLAGARRHRKP